jgi:intracellular septation protein
MSTGKAELSPGLRIAVDLGPLIVFLAGYWITKNVYIATAIFMVATAIAITVSKVKAGKISPLLWFSGAMVLLLGGLTLWLKDETFIKMKPTIYYLMVAGILFFGLLTRRPTLQLVLGQAYPGLTDRGWTLLTRNWALFFLALAVANEAVWRNFSFDFWLGYKLWGALPATLIFAAANVPMLMKHGLNMESAKEDPPVPPQG